MPMTKDQILSEAMALEPGERDDVAEALWQCVTPGEFTPAQLTEVRRRMAVLDSGEDLPIPGEQVMQELRQRIQGKRILKQS
jgi:putative addiction module component (TIGR02574 family)